MRFAHPFKILRCQENGGALADSAIPARAPLTADQDNLHSNYIEASIRWTRSHAWREPARIPQRLSGQYGLSTNDEPRHQPASLETRSNQRLCVSLGSPPLVAVGSSSARAAHRSRALQGVDLEFTIKIRISPGHGACSGRSCQGVFHALTSTRGSPAFRVVRRAHSELPGR